MKKKIIWSLFSVLLLIACNPDLGNYEYSEINTIDISGIDPMYVISPGDTLKIQPQLTASLGDNGDTYTYRWLCYRYRPNRNNHEEPSIWSETRDLSFPITGVWAKPVENVDYTCFYQVTNTVTGVSYTSSAFTVSVRNPYAIGYLALCEKADGFDIDMLASNAGKWEFFPNLLTYLNSSLPRGAGEAPLDIFAYWDILSPERYSPERYSVCVLSNRRTSRLHPTDYSDREEYDLSSVIISPKMDKQAFVAEKMVVRSGSGSYDLKSAGMNSRIHLYGSDHNWYFYHTPGESSIQQWYLFDEPINKPGNNRPTYQAAPFIAVNNDCAILFNETDRRFTSHVYTSQNTALITVPISPNANNTLLFTDDKEEGGQHSLVYMSDNYAILKNTNNQFKLVTWGGVSYNSQSGTMQPVNFRRGRIHSSCPDLNRVKSWFVYSNYLFYATESNVYALYLSDLINTPAGTTILNLESEKDLTSAVLNDGIHQSISFFKPVNSGICAGTYSNGAAGQNGKLEIFYLDPTEGTLIAVLSQTGLGKIVGVAYKSK
jgi:hypothetical protein